MPRFSNHLTNGTPQEEVRDALSSVQPWEDDNWTREQAVQRLCGYFEKAAKRIRNLERFKDAGEDEHQIKAMVEEFVKEGYGTAVGACYGKAWFDKVDLEKWIRPVYASAHMHMPVIRKWSPVAMAVKIQQRIFNHREERKKVAALWDTVETVCDRQGGGLECEEDMGYVYEHLKRSHVAARDRLLSNEGRLETLNARLQERRETFKHGRKDRICGWLLAWIRDFCVRAWRTTLQGRAEEFQIDFVTKLFQEVIHVGLIAKELRHMIGDGDPILGIVIAPSPLWVRRAVQKLLSAWNGDASSPEAVTAKLPRLAIATEPMESAPPAKRRKLSPKAAASTLAAEKEEKTALQQKAPPTMDEEAEIRVNEEETEEEEEIGRSDWDESSLLGKNDEDEEADWEAEVEEEEEKESDEEEDMEEGHPVDDCTGGVALEKPEWPPRPEAPPVCEWENGPLD